MQRYRVTTKQRREKMRLTKNMRDEILRKVTAGVPDVPKVAK